MSALAFFKNCTRWWLHLVTGAACALVLIGAVLFAMAERERVLDRAAEQAASMANYLSKDARDTFEITGLALTSVGRLIGTGALTQSQLDKVRLDMRELLNRVPRLNALSYYERSGWLITSSQETANDVSRNILRSPIFQKHLGSMRSDLEIGQPYQKIAGGAWMIDVSQPVFDAENEFNGLLVATMNVQYFVSFLGDFGQAADARVTLVGEAGHIFALQPFNEAMMGLDLSQTLVFNKVRYGLVTGSTRMVSPIDGSRRITAFHQLTGHPLTISYSVTEHSALADWEKTLPLRAVLTLAIVAAILFGARRLERYMRQRAASEATLLEMSRTDALTGLLNRRAFDHTLAREWLRCVATAKPLSVLMIDVDNFKSFNDTYGHQAGDVCLKAVAKALRTSVHFPADRVMRYGGEEFSVLLPNTPPDQIHVVSERVREAVQSLAIAHTGSASGIVTVSIGYATEDRRARVRGSEDQLIADADRALYAAKVDGRNRVVCGDTVARRPEPGSVPKLAHSG